MAKGADSSQKWKIENWMANKYLRRHSTSLAIKMQVNMRIIL